MIEDGTHLSDDALSDVAYLGRSRNRVEILAAIVAQPRSPREVADTADSARSTVERILTELEERGWAKRTTDGKYVGTDAGTFVIDEFAPMVRAMEAIRTLGDEISWLPRDELSISIAHFSDATVRHPDDPTEAIDHMTDVIRETAEFRVIANLRPPESTVNPVHERVRAGQMTFEYVLTRDVLEYLSTHTERRERWLDTVEAGADLWVWEGAIPCNLWIFDDTVWIKNSDPESRQDTYGVPIISDDDVVRSWGHDLIDSYQNAATPVDADAFAESSSAAPPVSGEESPLR
jgi:predicted transcriptional regulator